MSEFPMMNARQSRPEIFQGCNDEYKLSQLEAPEWMVRNEEIQAIQLAWLSKTMPQTFLSISEPSANNIINSKIWF